MLACLFDIDGTLVRSGGAWKHAFSHALREAFGVERVTDDVPFSGRTDRAIVRDLFQHHEIEETAQTWQTFRSAYLNQLPTSLAERDGTVLPGHYDLLQA
jgi:beta-phosphoglucomutase-like phosphatase (HAD superfamily)